MIDVFWNNVNFKITDIGGGTLGDDIPRHAHSKNSYELHFITEGSGSLITDNDTYMLKKGDFFITGPNFYHKQTSDADNPVGDVFIMLQAQNPSNANMVSLYFINTEFYYSDNFNTLIASEILKEFRLKKPDYKSAISGLAMKLMTDIIRLILPDSFSVDSSSASLNDRRFVIIEQAFLYNPNLTLTQLADMIGVCERQTQRLLKKYYGKSFREKKKESKNKNDSLK